MRGLALLLLALSLLVSCAEQPKKTGNPGDLYVEGVNLLKQKKYDKAIERFSAVRENYPFDPLAIVSAVKMGDAYFEKEEWVLASGIYEEFLKAHPEDGNVPYVLLQLAQCYEKLSLSIDRDQAYTVKAIERYTFLQNRYPTSMYAREGQEKIKRMTAKLADRELYVAEFYFRTYQYNAAIYRYEYFLSRYKDTKGTDSAYFHLSRCHREIGNIAKSDYYADLLRRDYPKSIYARAKTRERKSLQLAKGPSPATDAVEGTKRDIDLRADTVRAERPKEAEDLGFFDETKPIDIVADAMEGFEKGKRVVFKGSVVARQEDLYIFADVMEAFANEETNEIERVVAKGNVRIVKRDRTATSAEASFDNRTRIIILKGNVVVFSGSDRVTGELVTYYVNEERVVVEGEKEKKARITITPK